MQPSCTKVILDCVQDAKQTMHIRLPNGLPAGLVWLEVQSGSMLSREVPLLVAPSAELAAEINDHCKALCAASRPCGDMDTAVFEGFLVDLGALVSHHARGSSLSSLSSTAAR